MEFFSEFDQPNSQSHAIVGQNMERFEQNSEAVVNAVDSLLALGKLSTARQFSKI
jgi:hypothetical protein